MKTASSEAESATGTATPVAALERARRWSALIRRRVTAERRWLLPLLGTLIVFGGQVVEDLGDSPPLQMLPPTVVVQRWALILLVAYLLVIWEVVERTVERSLVELRPSVRIDDAAFSAYAVRMRTLPFRIDAVLLAVAGAISVTLFVVLGADLLVDDPVTGLRQTLPAHPLAAALVIAAYSVVGWAFLRLVVATARLARLLGSLTRQPLRVDVFDTNELLPFGNIALALALAPAGAIFILLIGLGTPTTPVSWSILLEASLATVLALVLPLRGVHRQMSDAKLAALATLSVRLNELYDVVSGTVPNEAEEASRLNQSTSALVQLRRTVMEMTTWPFRDTLAFGRALLIAAAPLIYTTLSELIKAFVIGPLVR